jgi:uncharacterized 2Fe-2S/4Fe-4S cluster protein (DUF4445 family)
MTRYHPITILPSGESVPVESGMTLLEGLRNRLAIRADCGGKGVCGKCQVFISWTERPFPITDSEQQQLSQALIDSGCRLACQIPVAGTMQVRIALTAQDNGHVAGKTLFSGPYRVDPAVHRRCLTRSSVSLRESRLETISDVSGWEEKKTGTSIPADDCALESLLQAVPPQSDLITAICRAAPARSTVISGHQPDSLGLAIDIGTTTVAAYLCDLTTGKILSSAAVLNPQRRHGEDVISRIQAAGASAQGLADLQRLILQAVRYLAERCLLMAGKSSEDVDDVVVVGNTAMQHIFAGIDPVSLGRTPFEPTVREAIHLPAAQLGLSLSPETQVFVMPVVAGFAGGDTVACALADRINRREEITLIVDVGTNGELVLGNRNGLWSASCATGPAFEGAQIACGMRATDGAISSCAFDSTARCFTYQTIGSHPNTPPLGFCGSGVIDAVLGLRNAGMLLPSGQIVNPGSINGVGKIIIVPADQNPAGMEIYLSQRDVRQIQLAKAALATGILCLLEKTGVTRVDRTILTGAFGHAFNWQHAVAIGMLPDTVVLGEVSTRNNLAGEGAVMALLDRRQRLEADEIRRQTKYLNLAEETGFIRRFVAQTLFP